MSLGEVQIIIRDVRPGGCGYVDFKPDIPSLGKLVLDFRRGEAFLKSDDEGWSDYCRMEIRRGKPGEQDLIYIFWPSWADEE